MVDPFIRFECPRTVSIHRQCPVFGIDSFTGTRRLFFTVLIGVGELENQRTIGTDIVIGE